MMPITKRADKNLPQDLQDTINTFVEQANIVEEYDLDTCLLYTSPSPRDS